MQRIMCEANNVCARDAPDSGYLFCQLGTYVKIFYNLKPQILIVIFIQICRWIPFGEIYFHSIGRLHPSWTTGPHWRELRPDLPTMQRALKFLWKKKKKGDFLVMSAGWIRACNPLSVKLSLSLLFYMWWRIDINYSELGFKNDSLFCYYRKKNYLVLIYFDEK